MRSGISGKIITLLLLVYAFSLQAQTGANHYPDSLLQVVRSSPDTTRLQAIMQLYRYHYNRGEFRSSLTYCKQALKLTNDLGDLKKVPRITYGIGLNYTQLIMYDSARIYLEKTEAFLKELSDPLLRIVCYHAQG